MGSYLQGIHRYGLVASDRRGGDGCHQQLHGVWPASSYHIVNRNCVHFAEDLLRRLKVPETFPVWVRGAADAGQSSLLKPMTNWGWRWMQQYYTDQPRRASADD